MADLDTPENTKFNFLNNITKSIFRTYDIRGIVETKLTPDAVYSIGLAFGTEAAEQNILTVIVGRDGRLSSPELFEALTTGLRQTGCDVIDIGTVPTPLLYFATQRLSSNTGIMITGSHNPVNYNGIKMVLNGITLSTEGVQNIYNRIITKEIKFTEKRKMTKEEIIPDYINYVSKNIKLAKPLHIVIDSGHGMAALVAAKLYRALGCTVDELFGDVDGHFPDHHPDPTIPKNLETLITTVKEKNADIGLAFDGDADRLGMVTNTGEIMWPDKQLMLFAKHIMPKYPGSSFVFDVKCSDNLPKVIEQYGGKPVMYRTGHSVLKKKMIELGCPIAGELSGHIFFKDRWLGFDDGIYVGARLLEILSQENRTCQEMFDEFPKTVNTPELKLYIDEDKKYALMDKLTKEAKFPGGKLITIDGIRVEFPYGLGLVRPSNTTPCFTLRFEANSEENLEKVKTIFRKELLELDANLKLPF